MKKLTVIGKATIKDTSVIKEWFESKEAKHWLDENWAPTAPGELPSGRIGFYDLQSEIPGLYKYLERTCEQSYNFNDLISAAKKALGFQCENPTYESCVANLCPYHVFTSDGVPTLVKIIKNYQIKELSTGNKKYGIALKTKIIPAFQDIINAIVKEMSEEDKAGIKTLIEEVLNG